MDGINFGRMSGMFSGTVKEVLNEAARMYADTLQDIVEEEDQQGLSRMPAQMMAWMMQHMPEE
jgi:hypothetical protein